MEVKDNHRTIQLNDKMANFMALNDPMLLIMGVILIIILIIICSKSLFHVLTAVANRCNTIVVAM